MTRKVAGVYTSEVYEASSITSLYVEPIVVLGKALTGSMEPTSVLSSTNLAELFGPEIVGDYGITGANKILKQASEVIYVRVASLGDKTVFGTKGTSTAKVFQSKVGGTSMNDHTVNVTVDDAKKLLTVELKDAKKATIETVQVSTDVNSASYVYDVFNTYSMYLDLVATNSYTFVTGELTAIVQGTEGASHATGTSEQLTVTTLNYDEYLNDAAFIVRQSTSGRRSAILRKGSTILEEIGEGAYDESATDFMNRINTQSSRVRVTKLPETTTSASVTLTGGSAGLNVTDDDYITALKQLEDTSILDVGILLIPGISSPSVVSFAQSLVSERKDCVYLVDPPKGLKSYQTSAWANGEGQYASGVRLESSHVAAFSPWVQSTDTSGNSMIIPPSIPVATLMASNSQTHYVWEACAGTRRGVLSDVTGLEYLPDKSDRTILNVNSIVNPIVYIQNVGYVVFGNSTALRSKFPVNPNPASSLNVRRLVNYIKTTLAQLCVDFVFELNDSYTWDEFKLLADPFLRAIKDNRGLYDYRLVMDDTTVTSEMIDSLRMPGIIRLKPTRTAEVIELSFTLEGSGISFSDEGGSDQ